MADTWFDRPINDETTWPTQDKQVSLYKFRHSDSDNIGKVSKEKGKKADTWRQTKPMPQAIKDDMN